MLDINDEHNAVRGGVADVIIFSAPVISCKIIIVSQMPGHYVTRRIRGAVRSTW